MAGTNLWLPLSCIDPFVLSCIPQLLAPPAVVLWCNWLALRTLNPVIRVQVSVEPAALKNCILLNFCGIAKVCLFN